MQYETRCDPCLAIQRVRDTETWRKQKFEEFENATKKYSRKNLNCISKSWKTMKRFAIKTLPRQGVITDYNGLQLVVRYQHSENGRPIYSGTTHYNSLSREIIEL